MRPTIYVDGGADFSSVTGSAGFPVVLRVGDGDSARGDMDLRLPEAKDFSDLAFVLRELPASVRRIEMLGFVGGRRDHELANWGEVHQFLKKASEFVRVDIVGPTETVVAFARGGIELKIEDTFSVMVLEGARVRIFGACEFPLDDMLVPASSRGLSNFGSGLVKVEAQSPCFVFLPARGT